MGYLAPTSEALHPDSSAGDKTFVNPTNHPYSFGYPHLNNTHAQNYSSSIPTFYPGSSNTVTPLKGQGTQPAATLFKSNGLFDTKSSQQQPGVEPNAQRKCCNAAKLAIPPQHGENGEPVIVNRCLNSSIPKVGIPSTAARSSPQAAGTVHYHGSRFPQGQDAQKASLAASAAPDADPVVSLLMVLCLVAVHFLCLQGFIYGGLMYPDTTFSFQNNAQALVIFCISTCTILASGIWILNLVGKMPSTSLDQTSASFGGVMALIAIGFYQIYLGSGNPFSVAISVFLAWWLGFVGEKRTGFLYCWAQECLCRESLAVSSPWPRLGVEAHNTLVEPKEDDSLCGPRNSNRDKCMAGIMAATKSRRAKPAGLGYCHPASLKEAKKARFDELLNEARYIRGYPMVGDNSKRM